MWSRPTPSGPSTWSFDAGTACDATGWQKVDNRILGDGVNRWRINPSFDGMGGIACEAAVLAGHDPCWVNPDGYDNDWYQGIRILYVGQATLDFDYLLDSELGSDELRVEVDRRCESFSQVNYHVDPCSRARSAPRRSWTTSWSATRRRPWPRTSPAARSPTRACSPSGTCGTGFPSASGRGSTSRSRTTLSFRRFGGNSYTASRIVQGWSVRGKTRSAGAQGCVTRWGHAFHWNSLNSFRWATYGFDMTPYVDPEAVEIQVRFRVTDWWHISRGCDGCGRRPGPGPYLDRVRIGRVPSEGPSFSVGLDSRSQAQDAFPTEIHAGVTPGTGEHFRPTTDRFGTAAFSQGAALGAMTTSSPNLITGDSIVIEVVDARASGGIAAVQWHGAIVAGPHAGKAPRPGTCRATVSSPCLPTAFGTRAVRRCWAGGSWISTMTTSAAATCSCTSGAPRTRWAASPRTRAA
jgi:hypothetical protein